MCRPNNLADSVSCVALAAFLPKLGHSLTSMPMLWGLATHGGRYALRAATRAAWHHSTLSVRFEQA